MEEEQKKSSVESEKAEETGKVENQTTETKKDNSEIDVKVEAQKIADAMVAKKLKGMPTKEELKAYHDWQENQKTEAQKQAEKETEYQNALSKNKELEQLLSVRDSGVSKDDADYVLFKVSKMEGEFEENLQEFLKENPKFLDTKKEVTQTVDLGGTHKEVSTPDLSKMSYEEYKEYRNKNK